MSLTVGRLVLAGLFPWVPHESRTEIVLLAAGSDLFDGWLSRRLGVAGPLGRWLDPIADKAFVAAVLVTLLREETLTPLEMLGVAARDLAVVGMALWSLVHGGDWRCEVSWLGKATTAAQLALLLALVHFEQVPSPFVLATALLSILTAADYLRRYVTSRRGGTELD